MTQFTIRSQASQRSRRFQPGEGKANRLRQHFQPFPEVAVTAVIVSISLVGLVGCHRDRSAAGEQPYAFLDHLADADRSPNDAVRIHSGEIAIRTHDKPVRAMFTHAASEVVFRAVPVPARVHLRFGVGIDEAGWRRGGDGAVFNVSVRTSQSEEVVFSRRLEPRTVSADRGWIRADVDLHRYAAQSVDFIFQTDTGEERKDDYDWCWWANPVVEDSATPAPPTVPPPYRFLDHLMDADRSPNDTRRIHAGEVAIRANDDPVRAIFAHANSQVVFHAVPVPTRGHLRFGIGIDEAGWRKGGDGAIFVVSVRTNRGEEVVFSRCLEPQTASADRGWIWADVDLERYGAQSVDFIFETDRGGRGTENRDWCWWANPILEECAECGIPRPAPGTAERALQPH